MLVRVLRLYYSGTIQTLSTDGAVSLIALGREMSPDASSAKLLGTKASPYDQHPAAKVITNSPRSKTAETPLWGSRFHVTCLGRQRLISKSLHDSSRRKRAAAARVCPAVTTMKLSRDQGDGAVVVP